LGYGHSPLDPLCPPPKTEKFCFAFNNKATREIIIEEKDKKMYAKGTLHSHSAITPFDSPNTVYAVHSLHFALPYFAPLRFAKHRIYLNVAQNSALLHFAQWAALHASRAPRSFTQTPPIIRHIFEKI